MVANPAAGLKIKKRFEGMESITPEVARHPRVPPRRVAVEPPKFVSGSLLRHILVMTGAGALGLVAIFVGDLANIYFLSLLNDQAIVAAIGYGSSIVALTISIGLGLLIATMSLVSPAIGAGRYVRARRVAASAHCWTFIVATILAVIIWFLIPTLLTLLGATGRTHELATRYLEILVPALPPLAVAMASTAVLRSVGDARRSMNVTLYGAVANVILDPVLIFGFGLGIEGAAIASVIARLVMLCIGLYGVIRVHRLMSRPRWRAMVSDARPLAMIAVPALATNIATPFANAYVTAAMSGFGDGAVAGWAIIGRIMPVAFGAIFALSGNVGPIIGQNFGAKKPDRMRQTLTLALCVAAAFTTFSWIVLAILAPFIVQAFKAEGQAAELILIFCYYLAPLFFFLGTLFVSNAIHNTLGRPQVSTALNWGRATIGTIPLVWIGGEIAGAYGVLAGNLGGGIVFGCIGVILSYRLIDHITQAPVSGTLKLARAPRSWWIRHRIRRRMDE